MGVLDWATILSATRRKMPTFYESFFFFFLGIGFSNTPAPKHRDTGRISNLVSKSSLGILATTGVGRWKSSPTESPNSEPTFQTTLTL